MSKPTTIRRRWNIENKLHGILDVAYRDDDHRLREGHAPENMATLRRITLSMLKQANIKNLGIKNRRLKAGWDENFLEAVLAKFLDN